MRKGRKGLGDGDIMEGRYANYFEIGHNAFEFLLDFGQMYFEDPDSLMHTRIVTNPLFAKRLAGSLNQALAQYEATHGRVAAEAEEPDGDAGPERIKADTRQ